MKYRSVWLDQVVKEKGIRIQRRIRRVCDFYHIGITVDSVVKLNNKFGVIYNQKVCKPFDCKFYDCKIQDKMPAESKASLDRCLKLLSSLGFVALRESTNRKTNVKKMTFYEISGNLLRFCFTFAAGSSSAVIKLGAEAYLESVWDNRNFYFLSL